MEEETETLKAKSRSQEVLARFQEDDDSDFDPPPKAKKLITLDDLSRQLNQIAVPDYAAGPDPFAEPPSTLTQETPTLTKNGGPAVSLLARDVDDLDDLEIPDNFTGILPKPSNREYPKSVNFVRNGSSSSYSETDDTPLTDLDMDFELAEVTDLRHRFEAKLARLVAEAELESKQLYQQFRPDSRSSSASEDFSDGFDLTSEQVNGGILTGFDEEALGVRYMHGKRIPKKASRSYLSSKKPAQVKKADLGRYGDGTELDTIPSLPLASLSRKASRQFQETLKKHRKPKLGLLRYINTEPVPISPQYGIQMQYNAKLHKWEGNEQELLRFEEPRAKKKPRKPDLIPFEGAKDQQIVGNMLFDPQSMRWVSLTRADDDVFAGLDDLKDVKGSSSPRKSPQKISSDTRLGRSLRNVSSRMKLNDDYDGFRVGDEFKVPSQVAERWKSDEARWEKKVRGWFDSTDYEYEYLYELRNMVMRNS